MMLIFCCLGPGLTSTSSNVDSAKMNLASSYVNGFVNAAFGQDKLLTGEGNKWIYKNKEHGNGYFVLMHFFRRKFNAAVDLD